MHDVRTSMSVAKESATELKCMTSPDTWTTVQANTRTCLWFEASCIKHADAKHTAQVHDIPWHLDNSTGTYIHVFGLRHLVRNMLTQSTAIVCGFSYMMGSRSMCMACVQAPWWRYLLATVSKEKVIKSVYENVKWIQTLSMLLV